METIDKKLSVNEMQKSAIIYRDASARFIFVCHHCGCMFVEINAILQHVESHFQVVNILVDQVAEDVKEVKFEEDNFAVTSDHVKVELFDSGNIGFVSPTSVPMSEDATKVHRTNSKELKRIVKDVKVKAKNIASHEESSVAGRSESKKLKKRPFRCHVCPRTCKITSVLQTHLKTHTDDELLQIFKCKKCDEYFRSAAALRVHVLVEHLNMKKLQCVTCTVKFKISQRFKFLEHLRLHNDSDNKQKEGINHRNSDLTNYEEIDSFTEERFPCNFCPQRFYIKSNLDAHMKSAHSNPHTLRCAQCNAIFNAPISYYAHQLEHRRVGPHITETNENVLRANLRALTDERIIYRDEFEEQKYGCLMCNFATNVRHDIREHVRRLHVYKLFTPPVKPKKEYICDICGKTCTLKHTMAKHLEIHTNTKSHACSICGRTFRCKSDVTIHERRHRGEKPYQCHVCGKAFACKGNLTLHRPAHENNSYPCQICGKIFRHPSRHRAHMETHRVERPFKCPICSKTFNTKTYLCRHKETHTDRKHPCRYCSSEFNTGDGLRQHYRHKHKDEWEALHPRNSNL